LAFIFTAGVLHKASFPLKKIGVVFLCLVISNLLIHPHYQSYFNLLIGKNENACKYFADSAVDWGQDRKELGEYLRQQGNPEVILSYFGTADPQYYGITYQNLESDGLDAVYEMNRYAHINSDAPLKEYLAVSATCRVGVDYPNHHWFDFLNSLRPVAVIGNSIFVYDITGDVSTYKHIARIYLDRGLKIHALRCGRVVALLNPYDEFGRSAVLASANMSKASYELGRRYENTNEVVKARKAYSLALALSPGYRPALERLKALQQVIAGGVSK
jgi:tetratricopeptide (TPR) repeat protein